MRTSKIKTPLYSAFIEMNLHTIGVGRIDKLSPQYMLDVFTNSDTHAMVV